MDERIEYGWVEPDPATGEMVIVKTAHIGRLRVRPVEAAPAETRTYETAWSEDGRTGVIVGKLFVDPFVLPAEIKTGADGRPTVRPIETAAQPQVGPGQRLVGPLYRIGPEAIARWWEVEDRPLDELRAERVAEVKGEMVERINDRLLEADDATDIRAAGRAALARLAEAVTAQEILAVTVDWTAPAEA